MRFAEKDIPRAYELHRRVTENADAVRDLPPISLAGPDLRINVEGVNKPVYVSRDLYLKMIQEEADKCRAEMQRLGIYASAEEEFRMTTEPPPASTAERINELLHPPPGAPTEMDFAQLQDELLPQSHTIYSAEIPPHERYVLRDDEGPGPCRLPRVFSAEAAAHAVNNPEGPVVEIHSGEQPPSPDMVLAPSNCTCLKDRNGDVVEDDPECKVHKKLRVLTTADCTCEIDSYRPDCPIHGESDIPF